MEDPNLIVAMDDVFYRKALDNLHPLAATHLLYCITKDELNAAITKSGNQCFVFIDAKINAFDGLKVGSEICAAFPEAQINLFIPTVYAEIVRKAKLAGFQAVFSRKQLEELLEQLLGFIDNSLQ